MSDATLISCPVCGGDVSTAEAEPLARVPCPRCGERVRATRSFDHFELLETLGSGGMGTVYKARDTHLERDVALKVLRKDLGPEYANQLQQEARITASINHPNVVQVFSFSRARQQYYLVMELVERGSLDDLMEERGKIPEDEMLRAGIEVARGLRAALQKGLIHRDVKPANILFATDGTARITDFGLAGLASARGPANVAVWGTPYYVAPERLESQPEDFRTDIYSLGATLFHALAGRPPFDGETNSAAELRALKNNPLQLSKLAPEISPATASIIERMIAPDPRLRFPSYDELIAGLENAQRSLRARSRPGLDPRRRTSRARRKIAILATAAAMFAIAGFGWFWSHRARTPPIASEAGERGPRGDAQWNAALESFQRAVAIYDFKGAATNLKRVRLTDASLAQLRDGYAHAADWLAEWKAQLISDINARGYTGRVVANDVEYTGISHASPTSLRMRNPYGFTELDWMQIPSPVLLTISRTFATNADRKWRCGVFAWSIGSVESARQLLDAACATKTSYKASRRFFDQPPP